jgi:hypothetical protein
MSDVEKISKLFTELFLRGYDDKSHLTSTYWKLVCAITSVVN